MSLGSLKPERVLACLIQLSKNKLPVRQESNCGFKDCNTGDGDVKAEKFEELAAPRISTVMNSGQQVQLRRPLSGRDEGDALRLRYNQGRRKYGVKATLPGSLGSTKRNTQKVRR